MGLCGSINLWSSSQNTKALSWSCWGSSPADGGGGRGEEVGGEGWEEGRWPSGSRLHSCSLATVSSVCWICAWPFNYLPGYCGIKWIGSGKEKSGRKECPHLLGAVQVISRGHEPRFMVSGSLCLSWWHTRLKTLVHMPQILLHKIWKISNLKGTTGCHIEWSQKEKNKYIFMHICGI